MLLVTDSGCNEDEQDPLCYKGQVVNLNQGDGCNNIIQIAGMNNNGGLPVGSTITFNPKLYKGKLTEGDIVYFKIIRYEKWVGPSNAYCPWPQYTAQIEFCNN